MRETHSWPAFLRSAAKHFFMQKAKLEEIAAYIREHRSREEDFEKLVAKLEEAKDGETGEILQPGMDAILTKAEAYKKAREIGGTAWPEFEKFVSEFERSIMEALREEV